MSFEETLRMILREELAPILNKRADHLQEDRLITAQQAAERLQVSARWLYKYADRLPYAVRLSRNVVRFSHNKIQEEIGRKLKIQQSKNGNR
jgi:predicted DNA-binding transcriptional regulator AlpA